MVPQTKETNNNSSSNTPALFLAGDKAENNLKVDDILAKDSFTNKFFRINYLIGTKFRRRYRKLYRKVYKAFLKFYSLAKKRSNKFANNVKTNILDGLTEFVLIFKRASDKYKKNKADVLNKRRSGVVSNIIIGSFVVQEIVKLILKFVAFLLNYLAPVAAVVLLTFTVRYFYNINYGIEVFLNGDSLGYIKDETVYEHAEKDMQQRIYLEGEDPLYTTPTFSIAVVSEEELWSVNQMANKIVQASSNDITQAAGLYIDGDFYGATSDGELLQKTVDGILESYKTGALDEEITFLQNIEIRDGGYYLNSTIKPTEDLTSVFYEEIDTEKVYVVQQGDSPSFIANSNGITTAELIALNPGIDEELKIGQELILNHSKPRMSIKKVVTEISEEAIAYEEQRVENTSKAIGFAQVTQEGENGLAEVSNRVTYIDGSRVESSEINRVTVKEAIPEQTVLGTYDSRTGKNVSMDELDAVKASGVFTWPVQSTGKITCGWLGYRGHYAIDIQSFMGDGTLAADDGVVVQVTYSNIGYGYHVIVDHLNGYRTLYAHNSKIHVEEGEFVKRGQVIASQGRTGNVQGRTGIHLHFEIIKNGTKVNPSEYLVK